MEPKALNVILGILTLLSFIWSAVSKEYRIIAIVIGFMLLIFLIVSEQDTKVNEIFKDQKRVEEKLKIHEQLIDIKADIKYLKEVKRNGKK